MVATAVDDEQQCRPVGAATASRRHCRAAVAIGEMLCPVVFGAVLQGSGGAQSSSPRYPGLNSDSALSAAASPARALICM